MRYRRRSGRGFTLIELIVTLAIIAVLAAALVPLAKNSVKREKEIELARALRTLREAIDQYKKMADEKAIEVDAEDSMGYPPDLQTLVKGVPLKRQADGRTAGSDEPQVRKFLRRIPKDPMTHSFDWGLRSYQDDLQSGRWGGENVYDVYTKSGETALDGTRYRDW